MIHRLITFLVLFTLITFINNYPLEESKEIKVISKETVVDSSKGDKIKLEESHTEKIYVTITTETIDLISTTKIDEDIIKDVKEAYLNINDKDKETENNKMKNDSMINIKKENDKERIQNKKAGNSNNEENDRYTKDNESINPIKININEENDRYTKDNEDVKQIKVNIKEENDRYTKENSNLSKVGDKEDCEEVNHMLKEIITKLTPKSGFDLLQIIFADAEVIEKRSTDLENSASIINDPRDLEVAANTVFRPLFVYKRQNERKKYKPFPLFK